MKNQKYILDKTDCIHIMGRELYRIKAVKKFTFAKKGQLGGYIESEKNLSQDGECWLDKDGICFGNAQIIENAVVDDAVVFDNAIIKGDARVFDSSNGMQIYGNAIVEGMVEGPGDIYGNAVIGRDLITRKIGGKCININSDKMDEWIQDRNIFPMDSLSYKYKK